MFSITLIVKNYNKGMSHKEGQEKKEENYDMN